MAALLRHGVRETLRKTGGPAFATKAEKKKGLDRKMPPKLESIAAKGFLRPQRPYRPPADADSRLDALLLNTGPRDLGDVGAKFALLAACATTFDHAVPNSLLHTVNTPEDVRNFYKAPVDVATPLDRMRTMDLPENMHVQFDYHRFHPDTDTKFGGQTAFNRSSTLVTGLKYKDKYKGHTQNQEWPFNS